MARSRLDGDLLAAAYQRDARRLLVFFTRRTYDAQIAVDLVGETYARAFELRRRFAGDAHDADALAGWIFGIARVVATGARATVAAAPADRQAVSRGDLPAGMRVFVAALDGAREVPLVTPRDASGVVLLVCRDGRCSTPTTEGSQ